MKRFDYEISSRIQAVCVLKTYFYVFCGGRSVYRYNATKNKCLRIPDMNITRTNPGMHLFKSKIMFYLSCIEMKYLLFIL